MTIEILSTPESFAGRFGECCHHYDRLRIAVAWCGDPAKTLPYGHLESFRGALEATVGTAFNQTHPDAFEWLAKRRAKVRVFRDDLALFHPKIYLFSSGSKFALFAGSSNFTYGGFHQNTEVNVFIEGSLRTSQSTGVVALRETLEKWRAERYSFVPTAQWLRAYRKAHALCIRRARKAKVTTEVTAEEGLASASWLQRAGWSFYYGKVVARLRHYEEGDAGIRRVLDGAKRLLKAPWSLAYFADIERRRMISGLGEYAALGHVGASGAFLSLMASGTDSEHRTIARAMNRIAKMSHPVQWFALRTTLEELVGLGPTMKAWGRLLCITRPDLFCTIASTSLRSNLSAVLGAPQSRLAEVDGYVEFIRLLHSSPWFNSRRPAANPEAYVWARRVAYLDSIFHSG